MPSLQFMFSCHARRLFLPFFFFSPLLCDRTGTLAIALEKKLAWPGWTWTWRRAAPTAMVGWATSLGSRCRLPWLSVATEEIWTKGGGGGRGGDYFPDKLLCLLKLAFPGTQRLTKSNKNFPNRSIQNILSLQLLS